MGLRSPGDLLITKRQWGAFHGTELDLQLRRRGIRTIVLARHRDEHGRGVDRARGVGARLRAVLFAEDAMSTMAAEMHDFAVKTIFPRLGRVVKSGDVLLS